MAQRPICRNGQGQVEKSNGRNRLIGARLPDQRVSQMDCPIIHQLSRAAIVVVAVMSIAANAAEQRATSRNGAVDGEALAAAIAHAERIPRTHGLLVAHEGEVVIEHVVRGPALHRPVNIKSLSKTVLSALIGIAVERGVIAGVDQPITELLGDRIPANIDPRLYRVTVGHLLSMQAGLRPTSGSNYGAWVTSRNWVTHALTQPFVTEPGGRMLYSTGNSHVLSAALTYRTGRDMLDLARDWLGNPLNVIVPAWSQDPQGIYFGGNDMHMSPRALLRFGELFRRGGVIDGANGTTRVLSREWIDASWTPRTVSPYTGDGYGYGWFITELAGQRAYYGRGFGGQMLYVIPSRALTIVITSDPEPPGPGTLHLTLLNGLVANTLVPLIQRVLAEQDLAEQERAGDYADRSNERQDARRERERDQQAVALHDSSSDARH
jgi:CubicO group peptidase (beta-lactamase class C family)